MGKTGESFLGVWVGEGPGGVILRRRNRRVFQWQVVQIGSRRCRCGHGTNRDRGKQAHGRADEQKPTFHGVVLPESPSQGICVMAHLA